MPTKNRPSVVPEIERMLDLYRESAAVCDTTGVYQMRKRLANGGYFTIRYGYRDRARKRLPRKSRG